MEEELWFSVDCETSGPTPSTGSLLSIGASVVGALDRGILVEFKPLADRPWSASAQDIHGLSREYLQEHGLEPAAAIRKFVEWVEQEAAGKRAVFVGFNATYDWMWVADAAWEHVGRNPFRNSGLDLKALYLGLHLGEIVQWQDTGLTEITQRYATGLPHTHNALDDAKEQGEICRLLLAVRNVSPPGLSD